MGILLKRQTATPSEVVTRIIAMSDALARFWMKSRGWAPSAAAAMLAAARLDRQASFARTLKDYLVPFPAEECDARLILGYVALRSMSEGMLKLFFAVWLNDYVKDPVQRRSAAVLPPDLSFDRLISLYSKKADSTHETFLRRVQHRGNGIHHFADRNVGTQAQLIADIARFRRFSLALNERLPYPDDDYDPARA
jgi:hypothetical protein